jgi:hypothetical protein
MTRRRGKRKGAKVRKVNEAEALRNIIRALVADGGSAEALIATARKAAPAQPRRKAKWDPKWKTERKVCPHCGETKVVDPDFGVRNVRGVERPQPWCRNCRATTNYHNLPRKNRSVNNPG